MSQTEFTRVARALQAEARARGLAVPAFRSPCTIGTRSIRRTRTGQVVVYVTHRGRDPHAVTSDMIDGVVAAQADLDQETRELIRAEMWIAAGEAVAA